MNALNVCWALSRVDKVPGGRVNARGQSQVWQLVLGAGPHRLTATNMTSCCYISTWMSSENKTTKPKHAQTHCTLKQRLNSKQGPTFWRPGFSLVSGIWMLTKWWLFYHDVLRLSSGLVVVAVYLIWLYPYWPTNEDICFLFYFYFFPNRYLGKQTNLCLIYETCISKDKLEFLAPSDFIWALLSCY